MGGDRDGKTLQRGLRDKNGCGGLPARRGPSQLWHASGIASHSDPTEPPPPLSLEMVVPADCAAEFTDANTADEGRPRRRWTGHRPGRWWRLWRTRSWVAATTLRPVRFDRVVVVVVRDEERRGAQSAMACQWHCKPFHSDQTTPPTLPGTLATAARKNSQAQQKQAAFPLL